MSNDDEPEEIYETTFRMPELTMLRLRRVYAETYADHELSWNKWLLSMTERGVTQRQEWEKTRAGDPL